MQKYPDFLNSNDGCFTNAIKRLREKLSDEGCDSLKTLHYWKNSDKILDECQIIVAIRPGFRPSDIDNKILAKIQFANIPRIEISSTQIRKRWKEDKTIRYMVTQQVWEFINENKLYL